MSQLIVVATITANPGSEAALEAILQTLVAPSRLEQGCLRYDLHREPAAPGTFVFLETWESRAALDAHMATPHFREARGRQEGLWATRNARHLEQI